MAGYIGSKVAVVSSGAERKKVFTATSGQTSFTGLSYTVNNVHVFQNGVRLVDGTDYTATNGNSITLTVGAATDDQVVVVSYNTFQTSDTVSASAGGTFSNAVTIDADGATVLTVDRATSDGTIIDLQKSGSSVGSIGTQAGTLQIDGTSGSTGLLFGASNIYPRDNGANSDGGVDLGGSSIRFKDLHLSGGVYLGGTGSANKLEDYEEGTWTPTVQGTTTAGTSTYTSTREASYVKIGRQVTVTCNLVLTAFSGAAGSAVVTGLPFAAASGFGVATGAFECDNVSFSSGYTTAYVTVFGGQSQVSYRQHGSSVTEAPINVTQVPAGNWQRFSITYFTDA